MPHIKTSFGVILAGGKASRMGHEDKALMKLGDKPIVQWVADSASHQVERLFLSINHHAERYNFLEIEQIKDYKNTYGGPLIGIVSALRHAKQSGATEEDLLACFPADVPWFPDNLVSQLATELKRSDGEVAIASEEEQLQPLFSVWAISCLNTLEDAIENGLYGPRLVLPRLRCSTVNFEKKAHLFHNINCQQDLADARRYLAEQQTMSPGQ